MSGKLETNRQLLTTVYPFLFFYLFACVLLAISQSRRQLAHGWSLYLIAIGWILLDQAMKQIAAATIKEGTSIPILGGLLHISNLRNYRGSWVLSYFDLQLEITPLLTNVVLATVVILGVIFFHRFYVATRRRSLWADVAFLGFFSGYAGFLCDMTARGYVLDFIRLPSVVAADLKDVTLAIGLAAFCAEILDNPELSWREVFRWRGWQQEWSSLVRFTKEFYRFTVREIQMLVQVFLRKMGVAASQD